MLEATIFPPSAKATLRAARFHDASVAIKILEPIVETAPDKPLDLLTKLCRLLADALNAAADGEQWMSVWVKLTRWEFVRGAWEAESGA